MDEILNDQEIPKDLDLPIEFEFEDIDYIVNIKAYKIGVIRLPDGRMIAPQSWIECFFPPYPVAFRIVEGEFSSVLAEVNPNPRFKK